MTDAVEELWRSSKTVAVRVGARTFVVTAWGVGLVCTSCQSNLLTHDVYGSRRALQCYGCGDGSVAPAPWDTFVRHGLTSAWFAAINELDGANVLAAYYGGLVLSDTLASLAVEAGLKA